MDCPKACALTMTLALLAIPVGAQNVTVEQPVTVGAAVPDTSRIADPDVRVTTTTKRCGTERACVPGFDVRVLRVTLPDSMYGLNASAVATIEVDNRGRRPSPAAELTVGGLDADAQRVAIPALPSGAHATVRMPVRMPNRPLSGIKVSAALDEQSMTGDKYSDNNNAETRYVGIEAPHIVWERIDAPQTARGNSRAAVRAVVRNASQVANTQPTTLKIFSSVCQGVPASGEVTPINVPALAPGGTFSFVAMVPTGTGQSCNTVPYEAVIDGGDRQQWATSDGRYSRFNIKIQ